MEQDSREILQQILEVLRSFQAQVAPLGENELPPLIEAERQMNLRRIAQMEAHIKATDARLDQLERRVMELESRMRKPN